MTTVKEFLIETLREITSAVEAYNAEASEDAQVGLGTRLAIEEKDTAEHGFIASSAGRATFVDFDIAINTQQKKVLEGSGGVEVASILSVGAEGSTESADSNLSRVKFRLPLNIPMVAEIKQLRERQN